METQYRTIFTLNARDNLLLTVAKNYSNLDFPQIFEVINETLAYLEKFLSKKRITYDRLKTGLIPNPKRNEIIFVFDSRKTNSSGYSHEVFAKIIPSFSRDSTHSVLSGDYIDIIGDQKRLKVELEKAISNQGRLDFVHSSQFYYVYINNLSGAMVSNLGNALSSYRAYVGYIDANKFPLMKTYASFILVNRFIKRGQDVLFGHEDDIPNDIDINTSGFPFEENGYVCKSVQSWLFGLFLSYKIEREVFPTYEQDMLFSLNAVTPEIIPLSELMLRIGQDKLTFVKRKGTFQEAGLSEISNEELEFRIREKINSNYIYNLRNSKRSGNVLFNIVLTLSVDKSGNPFRLMGAFEYKPREKILQLVTMF